jgi:hypothetical protein
VEENNQNLNAVNLPHPYPVLLHMDRNLIDIKCAPIGAGLRIADRLVRCTRTSGPISLGVHAWGKSAFFYTSSPN